MINSISLKNFKCFKNEISFPISNLNLITGTNGSGKSTLLQTIILMRQSIEHNISTNRILFNGTCLHLGGFSDIKNHSTTQADPIYLRFQFADENMTGSMEYELIENPSDEMVATISACNIKINHNDKAYDFIIRKNPDRSRYSFEGTEIESKIYGSFYNLTPYSTELKDVKETLLNSLDDAVKFHRTHYIGASRIGPQDFYFKHSLSNFPNVGANGEFGANILAKLSDNIVNEALRIGTDMTLAGQTSAWYESIFGIPIVEVKGSETNILSLTINKFKPANVGFGYSYIIPIIISCLIAKKGETVIIENPEAHLHPQAQSKLAKFIAKVAATGVLVFVESHSEHILNAFRLSVGVDKVLTPSQLNVLYFDASFENRFIPIPVDENGKIEKWPAGFFDQANSDFELLYGI